MNKNKYLAQNTVLFALSTFSTKIVAFLMVAFYTKVLTQSEYGIIDIIFTTVGLLFPVIGLSIHNSVLRFLMEDEKQKTNIISIAVWIAILGSLVFGGSVFLLRGFSQIGDYAVSIYLIGVLEVFFYIFAEFTRAVNHISVYVQANIIVTVATALLNVIFLGVLDLKVNGYLYATALSYVLALLYIQCRERVLKYCRGFGLDLLKHPLAKDMLKFSVYLIPNTLFWWITSVSDKYIILWLVNEAAVGMYAVSNKIPVIITSMGQVFSQAWQLSAIKERQSADRTEYTNKTYHFLFTSLLLLLSFLLVILKVFVSVYVDASYFESWKAASVLLVSAVYNIMASVVGSTYVVEKNNRKNMLSTLLGAMINIVLNILWIPRYGLMGAAASTALSYAAVNYYRIYDTRRMLPIKPFQTSSALTCILIAVQYYVIFTGQELISVANIILFGAVLAVNGKYFKYCFVTAKNLIVRKAGKQSELDE